jgi:hypothetical protein
MPIRERETNCANGDVKGNRRRDAARKLSRTIALAAKPRVSRVGEPPVVMREVGQHTGR